MRDETGEHHSDIVMSDAHSGDAAELLVLQRCCWMSEAIVNRTLDIPALHEDIATVRAWVDGSLVVIARRHHRLVGAVRGARTGSAWEVGRLMVAPDLAGQGLGRRLLELIENRAPGDSTTFSLFTGARSERNLRMYTQAGYTRKTTVKADVHQPISGVVFLTKQR